MSEKKSVRMPKLELGSGKQAGSLLALLLVLLAGLLLYGGVRQWQEGRGNRALIASRDAVAQAISQYLGQTRGKLETAVKAEAVQQAAAGGKDAAVEAALREALGEDAVHVEVLPADLQALYAKLPESGYGRIALAEQARGQEGVVMRLVRLGDARLLAAAAALPGEKVALAGWEEKRLQALFNQADAAEGYLALRQGNARVMEAGTASLADVAETDAVEIKNSDMRIAASLTPVEPGFLGLGAIPSLVAGGVLLLLAALALVLPRRLQKREVVSDEPQVTLAQLLNQEAPIKPVPASVAVPEAVPESDTSAATAGVQAPLPAAVPDKGIFRAYDIRGVVGETLDTDVARRVGQAIGSQMREQGLNEIVVGRDGRLSGPTLAAALIEGLRSTGCKVVDIGLAPTPLVYFAAYHLRAGSCVAVTGSHNPPSHNGFKIVIGGQTLSGADILALHTRISEGRLYQAEAPGELHEQDVAQDYIQRVAADVQLARPIKAVVDAGNGAAGELGPALLTALGVEVTPLYCEIDGRFPNHHPDPSDPHNLKDLMASVKASDADIGFAFDGDGDRLGVVTPSGKNIFPDRLLMLFAEDVLERQPGAVIVYDVKCTGAMQGFILRNGGSPMMWKTGHSLIKQKMRETGAELAGEMSGHFFFKERWYGFDDGIYAAARLVEILAGRSESADEVFAAIPEGVSTPELKIPMQDPHAFIERFVAAGGMDGARLTTIDGLRADWPHGWGLVRASNTTAVAVLRFEATDAEALARVQAAFRERLLALEPGLHLPF